MLMLLFVLDCRWLVDVSVFVPRVDHTSAITEATGSPAVIADADWPHAARNSKLQQRTMWRAWNKVCTFLITLKVVWNLNCKNRREKEKLRSATSKASICNDLVWNPSSRSSELLSQAEVAWHLCGKGESQEWPRVWTAWSSQLAQTAAGHLK